MAKLYGVLVGAIYAAAGISSKATSSAHENGTDHILRRDRIELSAAPVNDTISLLIAPSNTMLDPRESYIHHDALGASVTLSVGVATDDDALAPATAASSAGSFSLVKSVDIADWYKPLWQIAGLAKDPGGNIELLATIKGAAATGTVVWSIKGQRR